MKQAAFQSWGRISHADQEAIPLCWRHDPIPNIEAASVLPFGLGRSYGDSCLNDGGALLLTRDLNRFISFDTDTGILRCEAGVSFAEILATIVPEGWFLPVTPGTQFVTLGGAIANDVHGKNHHRSGTIGRFIKCFELLRSDGSRLLCSPSNNIEHFRAAIGGLGLTGLITWAEISLKRISSSQIASETIKFGSLADFFSINSESEHDFDYTVAWLDCLAKGPSLGRGHYIRGNHAPAHGSHSLHPSSKRGLRIPFDLPSRLLNSWTTRIFNFLYFHRQLRHRNSRLMPYASFFYPLDALADWNRLYGRRGFFQYQCVLPTEDNTAIRALLETIAASRQGSFLAVLKTFGDRAGPGLLSFPRPGVTLALDFPNRGPRSLRLFADLDAIVASAGGAVNPSKDHRMSAHHFQQFFPAWKEFSSYIDPNFSSSFWRRVTAT